MGNTNSCSKINYEDMQDCDRSGNSNNKPCLIINTISPERQSCLIVNTVSIESEEKMVNDWLKQNTGINIVIYGENANDDKIYEKYNQLKNLGFSNVFIYPGGLFEWLLLQDIYGEEEFSTTSKELDILKFKPKRGMGQLLLE